MNTAIDVFVEVRVDTVSQIEDRLDAAIQHLLPLTTRSRHGILVTRFNPGHFSICVSEQVPFGLTQEHDG